MYETVRNYQNPFQSDCNILQSHEQHMGLLSIPHLHKSLGFILAIYRYVVILQLLFAIVWWLKMLNKFLYAYVFLWSVCSNLEVKWKSLSHVWLVATPWNSMEDSPWNSPGQNTGVGSLCLLQRIFPTQGSNPGLPHCRQILYQLSHKGSPRILEWVASPFSRGSSWPRNRAGVSCIGGGFFTNWATREDPVLFIRWVVFLL